MRYAKITKLDNLMEKLSDDQLVDLVENTVKEGDELQHNPSLLTLERLVEVYGKGKACIDDLERRLELFGGPDRFQPSIFDTFGELFLTRLRG